MFIEIGHFALILALLLSCCQVILPLVGLSLKQQALVSDNFLKATRPVALGQCFFIGISLIALLYGFLNNDFSVVYIAQHSNSALPWFYKIGALWGGHEGSLLLWVFFFALWTVGVVLKSRYLPLVFGVRMLVVMGMVSLGFLAFILILSNPFIRAIGDLPLDGQDLNPLLQDMGLMIHPPILYLGYVGFGVPFAFAIAVLWLGKLENTWFHWLRPWVLMASSFLTLGIALGSFWAYYELGWGGWWFWDPVENASFMPCLIGIALIHSLMLSEKRQLAYGWTLVLCITAFALSLLGTFLVRSGILTSVHAFASDPKRGIYMLGFLVLVVGGAWGLYAARMHRLQITSYLIWCSREVAIFLGTALIFVAMASILLGTVFPLIVDTLTQQKISVGFPYFNAVFIPMMMPVFALIPLGPLVHWGYNEPIILMKKFRKTLAFTVILAMTCHFMLTSLPLFEIPSFTYAFDWSKYLRSLLALVFAFWILIGTFQMFLGKIRKRRGLRGLSLSAWGTTLAHGGVAIIIIGISLVSEYSIEKEVKISVGEVIKLAHYDLLLESIRLSEGPNYIGYKASFKIQKQGRLITELYPEKRTYLVQNIALAETAIDPGFFRDLYLALGERITDKTWSVKAHYKPFVRWIWAGALFITLGGIMAAINRFKH